MGKRKDVGDSEVNRVKQRICKYMLESMIIYKFFIFFIIKQQTACCISECDLRSDVYSSDL